MCEAAAGATTSSSSSSSAFCCCCHRFVTHLCGGDGAAERNRGHDNHNDEEVVMDESITSGFAITSIATTSISLPLLHQPSPPPPHYHSLTRKAAVEQRSKQAYHPPRCCRQQHFAIIPASASNATKSLPPTPTTLSCSPRWNASFGKHSPKLIDFHHHHHGPAETKRVKIEADNPQHHLLHKNYPATTAASCSRRPAKAGLLTSSTTKRCSTTLGVVANGSSGEKCRIAKCTTPQNHYYRAICIMGVFLLQYIGSRYRVAIAGPVNSAKQLPLERPDECCRRHQVPQRCVEALCYPSRPPSDFDVYDIFEQHLKPLGGGTDSKKAKLGISYSSSPSSSSSNDCSQYLGSVGECLAAGRDNSACCMAEAKDRDESTCFGLCRGEGLHTSSPQHPASTFSHHLRHHHGHHTHSWQRYQTCMAINLPTMLQCSEQGYREAPTPPRELVIGQVRANEAMLTWVEPAENAKLVARYEIYLRIAAAVDEKDRVAETSADDDSIDYSTQPPESIVLADGSQLLLKLTNLEPGANYEARVRACTSTVGAKSLLSHPVRFQTPGVAPVVEPHRQVVRVPVGSTIAQLACTFRVSSNGHFQARWLRGDGSGVELTAVGTTKFNSSHYLYSAQKQRLHMMLLEIGELDGGSDSGEYVCEVKDDYGKQQARVELRVVDESKEPSPQPPQTPLECCQSKGVETRCLPMCGGTGDAESTNKRYVARPLMPTNCSGEITKVLACAMSGVDETACCLREHVQQRCMYLCDSSLEAPKQMSITCLEHLGAVEKCRTEGLERRPPAIRNLRLQKTSASPASAGSGQQPANLIATWDPSPSAAFYQVYWRGKTSTDTESTSPWHLQSLKNSDGGSGDKSAHTSMHIKTAGAPASSTSSSAANDVVDEVVVVATNNYGRSQATKVVLRGADGTRWSTSSASSSSSSSSLSAAALDSSSGPAQ